LGSKLFWLTKYIVGKKISQYQEITKENPKVTKLSNLSIQDIETTATLFVKKNALLDKSLYYFASGSITPSDSLMKIENLPPSGYKVHQFIATEEISTTINIMQVCDCFGFSKNSVDAQIIIINENGEQFKPQFEKQNSMMYTNSYTHTFQPGKYFIIVYANNENLGTKLFTNFMIVFTPIPTWHTVNKSPYGKYNIYIHPKIKPIAK
jgi:hypothetical protein